LSLGELVAQLIENGAATGAGPGAGVPIGKGADDDHAEEKMEISVDGAESVPSLFDGSSPARVDPSTVHDEAESHSGAEDASPHRRRRSSITGAAGFHPTVGSGKDGDGAATGLADDQSAGAKNPGLSWADTRERITKHKAPLGREVLSTPPLVTRAMDMDEKTVGELLGQVVTSLPLSVPARHLRKRSDVIVDEIHAASQALLNSTHEEQPVDLQDSPLSPSAASVRYISHSYLRPARVLTTLRRTDVGAWSDSEELPGDKKDGGASVEASPTKKNRNRSPPSRSTVKTRVAHGFTSGKAAAAAKEEAASPGYQFKPALSTRARDDAAISSVDPMAGGSSAGARVIMPISSGYDRAMMKAKGKHSEPHTAPVGPSTSDTDLTSGGESEVDPTSDADASPSATSPTRGRGRLRRPEVPHVLHNDSSLHPLDEALSIIGSFHGRTSSSSVSPQRGRLQRKQIKGRSKKPFGEIRARLAAMEDPVTVAAKSAEDAAASSTAEKPPVENLLTENSSDPIWREAGVVAGLSKVDEIDSDGGGGGPPVLLGPGAIPPPLFHRKAHHRKREYSIHARTGVSLIGSLVDQQKKQDVTGKDVAAAMARQSSWVAATAERTEELVAVSSPKTRARELKKSASSSSKEGSSSTLFRQAPSGEAHLSAYAPSPMHTFLPPSTTPRAAVTEEKQDSNAKLPPVPSLPLDTSNGLFPSRSSEALNAQAGDAASSITQARFGVKGERQPATARVPAMIPTGSSGSLLAGGSQTARLPGEKSAIRIRPAHSSSVVESSPSVPSLRSLLRFTPAPLLPTPPTTPAPGEWAERGWMAGAGATGGGTSSTYVKPNAQARKLSLLAAQQPAQPPRPFEGRFAHRPPSPIETTPRYTFALPKKVPQIL
jgi:hypothetical protein